MSDRDRGLYDKFQVKRTDGSSEPGGKHENCGYFVLDIDHDKAAVPAIQAYADAVEAEYPFLARDLRMLTGSAPPTDLARLRDLVRRLRDELRWRIKYADDAATTARAMIAEADEELKR